MAKLRNGNAFALILVTSCFAIFSFAALCGYVVWDMRRDRVERATTATLNIAQALAGEISRTFELYDLSLRGAIEGLTNPAFETVTPELRQQFLFDRAATATYLNSMIILDANGRAIYDSLQTPARRLDASGKDYFVVHQLGQVEGLYVSRPLLSRLSRDWVVILSRRINHPDGTFAGVVVGSLSLQYFSTLFDRIKLAPGGAISLFRRDGTLIMREPYRYSLIGQEFANATVFDHYPQERSGSFTSLGLDGVKRDFAFSEIGNLPVVITVGTTRDEMLGDWQKKSVLLGLAVLGFSAVMIGLVALLAAANRRRALAEQQLARLASSDSLTGLANRRRFSEQLTIEWKQCLRDGTVLSVLMIDVDHFKAYNDHLGHLKGDTALVRVAERISACCRRPSDLVARFGGEEFVVLLPRTDLSGALEVAQMIRRDVETQAIQHVGSPLGILTVSIGGAALRRAEESPEDLLKRADDALYEAKRQGRNCSVPGLLPQVAE